jgi:hypothetical protein
MIAHYHISCAVKSQNFIQSVCISRKLQYQLSTSTNKVDQQTQYYIW